MGCGGHHQYLLPCGRAEEWEVLLQAGPHAQIQDPQQICRRREASGLLLPVPAPCGHAAPSLRRALLTWHPSAMHAGLQGRAGVVPVQAIGDWPRAACCPQRAIYGIKSPAQHHCVHTTR